VQAVDKMPLHSPLHAPLHFSCSFYVLLSVSVWFDTICDLTALMEKEAVSLEKAIMVP
jgi:hypothetical protein